MKRRKRTVAVLLLLLGLLACAWWLQRDAFSLERIVAQEERLRAWIDEHPVRAFAAGLGVYTLLSLVPGTGGKAIASGWLFGFWSGMAIINLGLTSAALAVFFFSRSLLLEFVQERFHAFARRMEEAWRRDGAFYLLTLRLAPVPYSWINYGAGATGVPAVTFWWTTQAGLLPKAAVYAFLGEQLPSLEVLATEGVGSLFNLWLIVALTLPALLPAAVRYALGRWRARPGESLNP